MAFATAQDLTDRYDARTIGKYASDSAVPVPPSALATNRRVRAALADASGLIASACIKGRRYPVDVLTTLAADETDGALLRRMTCALAMAGLLAGRVGGVDEVEELVFGYKEALENLNSLRNGDLVFNLEATLTATLPEATTGPPVSDPNRPTVWNPMFGSFIRRY
jgi:phage gp36-like protein